MNRDYIGDYDAIITASDQGAINFYRKFGFTEDAILLSKYKDIGDCWTNTTKMCYLPPYNVINEDPIRCLTMMDDQFQKWQKSMFHGYQNQAALFQRLKHEMIGLYAKSTSYQDDETRENEQLETLQMIREMEKISILNEKLLVAQMSLLMDDDCTAQMAVEYCRNRLKDAKNYEIKAEK
ncbi:unnamed protein product, partial [Adineta steineri]